MVAGKAGDVEAAMDLAPAGPEWGSYVRGWRDLVQGLFSCDPDLFKGFVSIRTTESKRDRDRGVLWLTSFLTYESEPGRRFEAVLTETPSSAGWLTVTLSTAGMFWGTRTGFGPPPPVQTIRDIVADREGNLFISTSDHGVARVDVVTGVVTIAVGTGKSWSSGDGGSADFGDDTVGSELRAAIDFAIDFAVDGDGNLFMVTPDFTTDFPAGVARRVDAKTGTMTAIAAECVVSRPILHEK